MAKNDVSGGWVSIDSAPEAIRRLGKLATNFNFGCLPTSSKLHKARSGSSRVLARPYACINYCPPRPVAVTLQLDPLEPLEPLSRSLLILPPTQMIAHPT